MRKLLIGILLLAACSAAAQGPSFVWDRVHMDGSRTGVTAPTADNVPQALGTYRDGVYYAPNGRTFRGGATAEVARLMIEAQPAMAFVKKVVGRSVREMPRGGRPQSALGSLIADRVIVKTEEVTGRHVDVGLINSGGIRVDLPEGDVLLDDILSMLPFANYLCYLSLKGSDLRRLFEQYGQEGRMVLAGVKLVFKDRVLQSALVGGEPLDDDRTYGVATIDFLLDGGDDIFAARNARELIQTQTLLRDAFLPYLEELLSAGKAVDYTYDGRVESL